MSARLKIHWKYAVFFILITLAALFPAFLMSNIVIFKGLDSLKEVLKKGEIEEYEETQHLAVKNLSGYLSQALFDPLYRLDIEGINLLIKQIKGETNITSILAADASGKVLTDGTKENPSYGAHLKIDAARLKTLPFLITETEDVHKAVFPIRVKENTIGYGEITFSKEPLKKHLKQHVSSIDSLWNKYQRYIVFLVLISTLTTIGVIIFLSRFFSRYLTAPLITLSNASKMVADGDFSASVPVESKDELGLLQENFNAMVRKLNDMNAKLAAHAKDLEKEVAIRTEELEQTLKRLMEEIAVRKEAEEELKVLATTDSLTGIYNRRKFEESLGIETQRAVRYKIPISLIEVDIDYFKNVNDIYGHLAGDDVLVEITKLVGKNIRDVDVFARWGGEEFMILVSHNDIEGARILAEKLRTMLEKHRIAGIGSVTCSFGAAQFNEGDTVDSFLKRTDDALYNAKRSGRNRVCIL